MRLHPFEAALLGSQLADSDSDGPASNRTRYSVCSRRGGREMKLAMPPVRRKTFVLEVGRKLREE